MQDAYRVASADTRKASRLPAGEMTSFDEYVSRLQATQKNVYFLVAPDRKLAESSPYFEDFSRRKIEVLFLYSNIDDFVMTNIGEFEGRKVVSAESGSINLEAESSDASGAGKDGKSDKEAEGGAGAADAAQKKGGRASPRRRPSR